MTREPHASGKHLCCPVCGAYGFAQPCSQLCACTKHIIDKLERLERVLQDIERLLRYN